MKLKVDIEKQIEEVKKCKSIVKTNSNEEMGIYYQGIYEALEWILRKREDGCFDISWLDANALKKRYLKEE